MCNSFSWYRLIKVCDTFTLIDATADYTTDPKNGIAISYVWGTPQIIDDKEHYHQHILPVTGDNSVASITIQLGDVWQIEDFLKVLWKATEGRPFWLDQLALPQNPESLESSLITRIPLIYKNHPVKVLVGAWPCEQIESWKHLFLHSDHVRIERTKFAHHLDSEECNNCSHLKTWLSRLWPRQEAYFAKSLQLIYLDPPYLGAISRISHYHCNDGLHSLLAMVSDKTNGPLSWFTKWGNLWELTANELFRIGMKLLAGKTVVFEESPSFERSIWRLGLSSKYVSKPRDLVIAVWCDPEGYIIPEGMEDMSVENLLQDAFDQYHRITGGRVPLAFIHRFSGNLRKPSLQPLYLPPLVIKDYYPLETMAWYQQWVEPLPGLRLDPHDLRVKGNVGAKSLRLYTIKQYLACYSSLGAVAGSLAHRLDQDYISMLRQQLMTYIGQSAPSFIGSDGDLDVNVHLYSKSKESSTH